MAPKSVVGQGEHGLLGAYIQILTGVGAAAAGHGRYGKDAAAQARLRLYRHGVTGLGGLQHIAARYVQKRAVCHDAVAQTGSRSLCRQHFHHLACAGTDVHRLRNARFQHGGLHPRAVAQIGL